MIYSVFKTNLGYIKIEEEDSRIISIKMLKDFNEDCEKTTEISQRAAKEIREYFEGRRENFTFLYDIRGTDFQKKVWRVIRKIPYGETVSYQEVAEEIGNKRASRAVAMACSKNPILFVVPCHRVVRSNGMLGGYSGGAEVKKTLIRIEKRYYKNKG